MIILVVICLECCHSEGHDDNDENYLLK